mgnify:CR=1 FL=1
MVYAIIESGGKQYRAVENGAIEVDRLPAETGQSITLDKVLLVADDEKAQVGSPYLSGVKVDATVIDHVKGPKLVIFKYEPKKRIRRKTGHRQEYTRLMIKSISYDGKIEKNNQTEQTTEKKSQPRTVAQKSAAITTDKKAVKAAEKPAVKKTAKTNPEK